MMNPTCTSAMLSSSAVPLEDYETEACCLQEHQNDQNQNYEKPLPSDVGQEASLDHGDQDNSFEATSKPLYVCREVYLLPREYVPYPGTNRYPDYPQQKLPKENTRHEVTSCRKEASSAPTEKSGPSSSVLVQEQGDQDLMQAINEHLFLEHQQQVQEKKRRRSPSVNPSSGRKKLKPTSHDRLPSIVESSSCSQMWHEGTENVDDCNNNAENESTSKSESESATSGLIPCPDVLPSQLLQASANSKSPPMLTAQQTEQMLASLVLGVDKKPRTIFTDAQYSQMKAVFKDSPYLNRTVKAQLADSLKIPEETVAVWFKNQRSKLKRQHYPVIKSEHI